MKSWELSLAIAHGQVAAACRALVVTGGNLMPREARVQLELAQKALWECVRLLDEETRRLSVEDWPSPWRES